MKLHCIVNSLNTQKLFKAYSKLVIDNITYIVNVDSTVFSFLFYVYHALNILFVDGPLAHVHRIRPLDNFHPKLGYH